MKIRTLLTVDTREEIFLDVIHELWKYSDSGIKKVAERAGCSWKTLYKWKAGSTNAPRIDTLAPVARVLGYNITLAKTKRPVPKFLRSVK